MADFDIMSAITGTAPPLSPSEREDIQRRREAAELEHLAQRDAVPAPDETTAQQQGGDVGYVGAIDTPAGPVARAPSVPSIAPLRRELAGAQEAQQAALLEKARIAQGVANQARAMQEDLREDLHIADREQELAQEAIHVRAMKAAKRLQDDRRELMRDDNIDPDRYLKNMDLGSRIMLVASMGFGTQADRNAMLNYVQRNVEADIHAQKSDIERRQQKKEGAAARSESLYGALMRKYGDGPLAAAKAKALIYDQFSKMLALKGQVAQDEISAQGFLQSAAMLRAQAIAEEMRARERASAAARPDVPTKEPSKEVKEAVAGAGDVLSEIDNAIRIVRKKGQWNYLGRKIPNSDQKFLEEMIISPMTRKIASAAQKGTLSDSDIKPYSRMLQGALTTSDELLRRLLYIRRQTIDSVNRRLRVEGKYRNIDPLSGEVQQYGSPTRRPKIRATPQR